MGREALVSPSSPNQRSRTRGQGSTSAGPPLFIELGQRFGRPGGVSPLNTSRFFSMKVVMLGGTSSSGKMAVTGHSGSHAPQSMHSSGWI